MIVTILMKAIPFESSLLNLSTNNLTGYLGHPLVPPTR